MKTIGALKIGDRRRWRAMLVFVLVMVSILEQSALAGTQVRITRGIELRQLGESGGTQALTMVRMLPVGSVVEYETEKFQDPEFIPYVDGQLRDSRFGFVRGIRVISVPGASAAEVATMNQTTLFMSKNLIARNNRPATSAGTLAARPTERSRLPRPAPVYAGGAPVVEGDVVTRPRDATRMVEETIERLRRAGTQDAIGAACPGGRCDTVRPTANIVPPNESAADSRCLPASTTPTGPREPMAPRLMELANQASGLSIAALESTRAWLAANESSVTNRRYVSIIDYGQPSTEQRLYVFDLQTGRVERHLVAHGVGSARGPNGYDARLVRRAYYEPVATRFTNGNGRNDTNTSSSGAMLTGLIHHRDTTGRSLGLRGVVQGINDRVCARGIVMHSADYVSQDVTRQGRLGQSNGCPTLDPRVANRVMDQIQGGSLIYSYAPPTVRRY